MIFISILENFMLLDKIKIIIPAICSFYFLMAGSYASGVGTYAGNWLHLETSVRSVGMGRAQVATGSGVGSISGQIKIKMMNPVTTIPIKEPIQSITPYFSLSLFIIYFFIK